MFVRINSENFNESLVKYKRFIWFIYFDGQEDEKYFMNIKPSWSTNKSELTNEINNLFPDLIIGESKISEVMEILLGFNISMTEAWDDRNKHIRPFFISIDKGWIKSHSIGKCYCLDTVMEMIYDIHPELFEQ